MANRAGAVVRAVLVTALVTIALGGCAGATGSGSGGSGSGGSGSGGSGSGGSGSDDVTGNWQLVSGTDEKGVITPGPAVVTFKLNGASSGGHGPCNSFGATTKGTTIGTITIVVGIHTEMACVDPDLNTTEARYFAALDKVTSAALDHGTLTLSGDGDTLVFTKARQ
jgi:heat shock protein HslJ